MDLIMDAVCIAKEERLYLADYLVENCDGYYQDIGIPKRKIKGKDY